MPTSNYAEFYVQDEDEAGVITSVGAGVSVGVFSVALAADVAESPLTTDSDGKIAAGTATAAVGDRLHFRVENYNGKAFSVSQITT